MVIPLMILGYEMIILKKSSVNVHFSGTIGLIVVLYYCIFLILGILWVITKLKSIMNLKNEKTKNEMLHLQSQVNPHFFFNMLNNLYGLVDKDAEKSKALILKLSDLMRYSIYEGEKSQVSLEDEVAYLKNYIELHQMRYRKKIDIQFNVNIESKGIKLTPLFFIILLENAFKHGVENLRENAYVHLNLNASSSIIDFEIENNFDANEISDPKGIGIKNLKRRLELVYPKKHTLIFTSNNSVYKAKLQLQL